MKNDKGLIRFGKFASLQVFFFFFFQSNNIYIYIFFWQICGGSRNEIMLLNISLSDRFDNGANGRTSFVRTKKEQEEGRERGDR